LVFLDQTRALGTRLSVRFYPSQILAIAALLFFPDCDHGTSRGQMVFIFTRKAEGVSAFTIHNIIERVNSFFGHKIASFLRAPLYVLVLISHLFAVPVQILLTDAILDWEVIQEKAVRHHDVAPQLRTFCEDTTGSIRGYFVNQKMFPAQLVELMAATQLIGLILQILVIEFNKAYLARVAIIFGQ
jgi:hypothetical protein